jgi:hypothetical protein
MVQRFKQITMASAVALAFTAPAAWAAGVHFDPDGAGAAPTQILQQMDWGTGHVLYSGCFGTTGLGAGSSCTIRAQGGIGSGAGGGLVGPALPPGVAYTFELQTRSTSSDPDGSYNGTAPTAGGNTVAFSSTGVLADYTASFFRIFVDSAAPGDPNPLAGTGYGDGTLILEGRVNVVDYSLTNVQAVGVQNLDQNGANDYVGVNTRATGGTPTFTIDVTFINSLYFKDPLAAFLLNLAPDANHTDNSGTPFKSTDPAHLVVGTPFTGSVAEVGIDKTSDIYCGAKGVTCSGQFQGDASTVFLVDAVPEPGMLALLGIGFAGLAAFARRRRENETA